MSLFRLIAATKWTSKALLIAIATYTCHSEIERFVKTIEFYSHKSEIGYVRKDQALDLEIVHELNGKGNLETYVKNYSQMLPVFIGESGIVVGTKEYNMSNLDDIDINTLKLRAQGYYDE